MAVVNTGALSPSTASGTNWTNPTNVTASDDSRADYATAAQDDLFVTGFGATIPAGSRIGYFQFTVEGFGVDSLAEANRETVESRFKDLMQFVSV